MPNGAMFLGAIIGIVIGIIIGAVVAWRKVSAMNREHREKQELPGTQPDVRSGSDTPSRERE